MAENCRHY